jgi:hypothetical protein
LLQTLEERRLTTGDLRQFLESILTAVCDLIQVDVGFIVALKPVGMEFIINIGDDIKLRQPDLPAELLRVVNENGSTEGMEENPLRLFSWDVYWVIPMFERQNGDKALLGMLGMVRKPETPLDSEQRGSLVALVTRATIALEDRVTQQKVFSSLQSLAPEVAMIQRLRAASSYDGSYILSEPDLIVEKTGNQNINKWVKDALSHYWGGPKLTESPLLRLEVVQQALEKHDGGSVNALRSILKEAIERVRPEGERRFTAEWILYNILEMKFMEGRKVREIALRLAMSEADLYRKQRVAVEAVANAILEMDVLAREEKPR